MSAVGLLLTAPYLPLTLIVAFLGLLMATYGFAKGAHDFKVGALPFTEIRCALGGLLLLAAPVAVAFLTDWVPTWLHPEMLAESMPAVTAGGLGTGLFWTYWVLAVLPGALVAPGPIAMAREWEEERFLFALGRRDR